MWRKRSIMAGVNRRRGGMAEMRKGLVAFAIIGLALIAPSLGWAARVGAPAPDFTATDTNGQVHKLSEYQGKFVVLEWTNRGCPYTQKHYNSGNMQRLQREWTSRGVVWLTIVSSAPGALEDLPHAARDLVIAREIRGYEDRIGTQSFRLYCWHGRVHTEAPGLVRSSADDRAIALPRNDHGLAEQLRIIALLDRSVKRVHVAVDDFSHNLLAIILLRVQHRAADRADR